MADADLGFGQTAKSAASHYYCMYVHRQVHKHIQSIRIHVNVDESIYIYTSSERKRESWPIGWLDNRILTS